MQKLKYVFMTLSMLRIATRHSHRQLEAEEEPT